MYIMIAVIALHGIFGYIFIIWLEYDIFGAAIAYDLSYLFCFIMLNIMAR